MLMKGGIVFGFFLALLFVPLLVNAQNYDIGMEISTEQVSVCPCTPITEVDLTVTNFDDIPHSYQLSLEIPSDWTGHPEMGTSIDVVTVEGKKVLEPGESSEPMQIYVTPSCFTRPGVYSLKAIVSTNGQSNYRTFEVEILPCHYVEIVSTDRIDTCKSKPTSFAVTVTNFGKIKEDFAMEIQTSWGDVLLSTEKTLEPDVPEVMEFEIMPPEILGSFAIIVDVASLESYATNYRSIQLNVDNCYDFNADIKPPSSIVCLGKTTKYKLIIDNVGREKDTYNVIVPDMVTPEMETVELEPNEEGIIDLFVEPNILGKSDFEVLVSSNNLPTVKKTVTASIEAIECRDVALVTYPTEQELCQGGTAEFELIVKNTGTVEDIYELDTDFGELGEGAVSLLPGEVRRVKLLVDTGKMSPGETMDINLEARSGEVYDTNTVEVFAKNCYSAQFEVIPEEKTVCVGDEVVYDISVRNTGEFAETYSLQMVKEIMDEFTLEPGEEYSLTRTLHAFFPAGNTYDIPFRLVSNHVFEERVMKINVSPLEECFSCDLRDSEVMEIDSDVGIGKAVKLKLSNTGKRKDAYEVILDGPDWTYLSSEQAVLEPGASKEFYVYISPTYWVESGTYDVTAKAISTYSGDDYTFYITVESVFPGEGEEPEMIIDIMLPTGGIVGGEIDYETVKVGILAVIVLVIVIILAVKFVMFVK